MSMLAVMAMFSMVCLAGPLQVFAVADKVAVIMIGSPGLSAIHAKHDAERQGCEPLSKFLIFENPDVEVLPVCGFLLLQTDSADEPDETEQQSGVRHGPTPKPVNTVRFSSSTVNVCTST